MSPQKLLVAEDVSADRAQAPPDESAPDETTVIETAKRSRQSRFRGGFRWLAIVVTLLMVAAAVTAAWQYVAHYRSDVETNARVGDTVLAAAREGTVSILSYSPDTLERDFTTAKSHLAGDFLAYYDGFTEQVVRPAATEKKVKTTAEVKRAALSELHPDSAKVLVFIDQNTMSADKPDPVLTSSSVLVTLDRHGNSWLISGFDPV
jgi:Mce-associated membrane protein